MSETKIMVRRCERVPDPVAHHDLMRVIEMGVAFVRSSVFGEFIHADHARIGGLAITVMEMGEIFLAEVVPEIGGESQIIGMLAIASLEHPMTGQRYADEIAWYVEPAYRSCGAGPLLLEAAEAWARQNQLSMVKMVAPAGSTIGHFYEKHGYRAVETAYWKDLS